MRGDPKRLGDEVPRHFPAVLGGQQLPADCNDSGRLQLADWLTDPKNPLTARVMVNRIWQHHFGKRHRRRRPTISADRAGHRRTPSCSTSWPAVSSKAAGRSRRCTGSFCCRRPGSLPAPTSSRMRRSTRTTSCSGSSAAAVWMPSRSATRCCSSAANSTKARRRPASVSACEELGLHAACALRGRV